MIALQALAILILPLAAWLPGALAVSLWGKRLRDDPLEFLFAGLAFGVLILGWLALLLAEVGYFSLGRLAALWGVLVLGLGWRFRVGQCRAQLNSGARKHPEQQPASSATWRINRWESAGLLLWLAVAAWLFFRPH
ncbi:MAG: hypothetical protein QG637_352, partial [Chloroflexota bacterium]|nr:hypothetical protein [Chloroflexota bacterium]